jgi:hypothetical protein
LGFIFVHFLPTFFGVSGHQLPDDAVHGGGFGGAEPGGAAYGWPTNETLSLVGVNWVIRNFLKRRADGERDFKTQLSTVAPDIAESRQGR